MKTKKYGAASYPCFRASLLNEIISKYTDLPPLFSYPFGYRHEKKSYC